MISEMTRPVLRLEGPSGSLVNAWLMTAGVPVIFSKL
jgi:hypothetical protein